MKDWPAGVQPRGELSSARSYDYDFSNISVSTLQTWLGRVGIEVPVQLDGKLSGWIWVQRSANGWFDFSNYNLEGEINSPELNIDKWLVREAKVRFGYAGGNWYVGKIAGEIRSAGDASPIGIADAKAKLLTASNSTVEITAKVDSIDLQALLRSFGLDVEIGNSDGSLLIAGSFPIAAASDLSTWTAKANVALENLTTPWIESEGKAFASLELRSGIWKFTDGRIKVAAQDLKIAGTGKLSEDLPLELSVTGDQIDVRQLLQQLKNAELADQVEGSIQLVATVNANRSQGLKRAVATVKSSALEVRAQAIKNVNVMADYTPAGIKLEIVGADLAGGSMTGAASWKDLAALERGFPSATDLKIQTILLEELVWVELPVAIAGTASGSLSFGVEKQDGWDDWCSTGNLKIDGLKVAGTGIGDATLTLKKELSASELTGGIALKQGGGAVASKFVLSLETQPEATVRATNLNRYRAEGQLDNYNLVARIENKDDGLIPITAFGNFKVSGTPGGWFEQGSASLSNSSARLGDQLLRLELADISFNESEFRVERFRLLDSAGRVAGAASLRRDGVGEHLLRLRVVETPLKPYLQRLAPGSLSSIAGVATIELELRKNAENANLNRDWRGTTSGRFTSLVYQGKPIGDLNFKGEVRDDVVTAAIDGMLIGGEANGSLRIPFSIFEATANPNATTANVDLKIANVQAKRLAGFLLKGRFAKDIAGSLSLELNAQATSSSNPVFAGRLDIPLLKQQNRTLVRDFSASLNYSDDRISIEKLAGGFAGGRVDAQGYVKLNLENGSAVDSARVNFVTQRLDANHLVSLVSPEYAEYFSGAIDYRGIATYQRGFRLNGSAVVKNGNLFGIPIQVGRGGLRTELTPAGEFSRAVSRDLHGIGFGGRFQSKLDIRKETNFTLKTSGRIAQGKLEQLGRVLGFEKTIGSGTFHGSFDLESDQIELIRALNGGLQIEFENGDLNSIPLLSSIDRFVPLLQFASTDIENGRLDARLGQGQMRIADLIVTSKAFLLAASGGVALDGSKLDLDVVVQTGGSVQQQLTQTAIERMLVSPIPQVAVINELNELIRNRSVFLHVGGRTSQPVIQAKSAQTAAKAFLQTLGRQAIGATPTTNQ